MEFGSDVELLFHRLAGLSRREQQQILTSEGVPASVRAEVESLLALDELSSCVLEDVVHGAVSDTLDSPALANARCGVYRLVELIGHGGMGSVYLAERADGEVEQRVAVKLLRISTDTAEARQQFQKERQILADLSHPHIARLLDAGRADDGRPFLAMEYVDGTPIDEFCRDLTLRERVQLLEVLCGAIVYAHSMLVVHRDVKPGNVLIDASGAPKLLDFGIAKLMDTAGDTTATADRRLTPQYASPEQILGRPVGAASDIFSLGSLLYFLITSQPPFRYQDYPTRSELQRAVCERQPIRPSEWNNKIDKDLEAIVRRAMRKEPNERYESADALREDLRAWLDRKPVKARQGNWWYLTRRQLRRQWIPATACAVTVVGLAIGLGIALHESNAAKRRFDDVHKLANEMLEAGDDIEELPGATEVRERIAKTSLDYLERLSRDAGHDVNLEMDIGSGYRLISEIQGGVGKLNLGHSGEAASNLERSEHFLHDAWRQRPDDARVLRALILTVNAQVLLDTGLSRFSELRQSVKELHNLALEFERIAPDQPTKWGALSDSYDSLALAAHKLRENAEALRFAKQSVEFQRELVSKQDNRYTRSNLAISMHSYGLLMSSAGDLNGGLRVQREGLAILNQVAATVKDDSVLILNIGAAHSDIGTLLNEQGELIEDGAGGEEAVSELEQGLAWFRKTVRRDPSDNETALGLTSSAMELGRVLQTANAKKALAACEEAIAVLRALPAQNARRNSALSTALSESASLLCKLGRRAEGEKRLAEARMLLAGTVDTGSSNVDLATDPFQVFSQAKADQLVASGRLPEAIREHESWLSLAASNGAGKSWTLPDALIVAHRYRALAGLYESAGAVDKQQQTMRMRSQLLALWRRTSQP